MGALVDSSAFVAVEKAEPGRDWLKRALSNDGGLFVNPVIVAELQLGVALAPTVPLALARQKTLDWALRAGLLDIGRDTARHYAEINAILWRTKKSRLRNKDIWIAATAREHNLPLITVNHRDFSDIEGLSLVGVEASPPLTAP